MNMLGEKLPVELIKPQLKSQVREMGHKIYHQCIQIIADSFCKPLGETIYTDWRVANSYCLSMAV